ncbi:MAG: SUMF1/EgtB/PvdO family nonheme iron enzyme [Geminicoccaceae bacterium]
MSGPVDIDPEEPHAFLSYTRFDDKFLNGGISALREALEQAVQARTGKPFNIFQDVDDIKPGDAWQKKLDRAIQAAQLFIPILTPRFFESDFCKNEAQAFLDYEARAGRDDLVLPIYLIDTPKLDAAEQRAADEIASRLHERQYADWRPLRHKLRHEDTRPRIDELAGAIALAIARNSQTAPAPPPPQQQLSAAIENRLDALESKVEERDRAIVAERSRRQRLEKELADEKARVRELDEAPATFEGQAKEARKREAALLGEIESLKAQFAKRDGMSAKQRLVEAEEALEQERAKREKLERRSPGIPRWFYLGAAALLLLVGAVGWFAGQEVAPPIVTDADLDEQIDDLTRRLRDAEAKLTRQAIMPDIQPHTSLSTFEDCTICPEMVVIPAGSFFMGSRGSEANSRDNERPRHKVNIQIFAIGKYEVTFAKWDACVAARGCDHQPHDKGWGRGLRPVINVSWEDAQQYIAWLSRETGEMYRLPSEAEWEYAARALPTSIGPNPPAYAFGDSITKEQANFGGNIGSTTEIGSYPANDWGLHDMHGNVWEWVQDRWQNSYDGAPIDGTAWLRGTSSYRMLRGGSWYSKPESVRSAFRYWLPPVNRGSGMGFRLAKTLTP